jgi:hypothetical protein
METEKESSGSKAGVADRRNRWSERKFSGTGNENVDTN